MYAQNAANCNSLQLFLPPLQLFTNYQFKHLPVVRAANERGAAMHKLCAGAMHIAWLPHGFPQSHPMLADT